MTPPDIGALATCAALCVAAVGCGEPGSETSVTFTVADSAGVQVVHSFRPAAPDSVTLELGDVVLDLSESGFAFDGVQDFVRVGDTYVVAERTRIVAFSLAGELAWQFGREGDGPMEFRRVSDLEVRGDSVAVFDYWRGRVTLLDREGGWIRGFGLGVDLLAPDLVPVSTGTLAVQTTLPTALAADAPAGLRRSPGVVLTFDWEGQFQDSVARVEGFESVGVPTPDGMMDQRPIFGHASHVGARAGRIVRGDGEWFGFDELRLDGSVARVVSAAFDLSLGDDLLEAEWDERSQLLGPDETRRLRETTPVPSRRPAYSDLQVAADGSVWLREHIGEFLTRMGSEPRVWHVFGADGVWRGRAEVPADFAVLEVGEASLNGVYRDALDVEHPQVRLLAEWRAGR